MCANHKPKLFADATWPTILLIVALAAVWAEPITSLFTGTTHP